MLVKLNIPEPVLFKKQKGQLHPSVAEFREEDEKNLKINFHYYNDKVCEIKLLSKKSQNALKRLKLIGQSTRSTLESNGIQLKQVHNLGDYKKLFKSNLPDGFIDGMREHGFSGSCRIFCTLEGDVCNVIAITANHFETKKHRK